MPRGDRATGPFALNEFTLPAYFSLLLTLANVAALLLWFRVTGPKPAKPGESVYEPLTRTDSATHSRPLVLAWPLTRVARFLCRARARAAPESRHVGDVHGVNSRGQVGACAIVA